MDKIYTELEAEITELETSLDTAILSKEVAHEKLKVCAEVIRQVTAELNSCKIELQMTQATALRNQVNTEVARHHALTHAFTTGKAVMFYKRLQGSWLGRRVLGLLEHD